MTARCGASSRSYFQLAFDLDSVKAMATEHPEWKSTQPFKAFLSGDKNGLAAQGEKGLLTLLAVSHSGMTTPDLGLSGLLPMMSARR